MKKSKILAVLLCMAMLFTLAAACGGNGESTSSSPGGSTSPSGSAAASPSGSASVPPSGSASSPDTAASPSGDAASGEPAVSGRDTLSVAVTGDYGTLSPPTIAGSGVSGYWQAILSIFEPLWNKTFDGEITYMLAESYEVHDSRHWTINLREGINFSNGNPFTAEDFIFTAELARDVGGIASAGRIQDFDWENIKAIDEYTIDMRWTTDRSEKIFFDIISALPMMDKESYDEADAAIHPIGTGPYVVTEYVINSHCYMERNEDYWGELPYIKYLNFKVLAEPAQRVNALETGDVDIAEITAQDVEYVENLPDMDVRSHYSANWTAMRFNIVEGRLFHDINARRAVAHAINKQALLDVVYGGIGEVMNGPMTKACLDYLPEYDNTDDTYTIGYDIELAKQYAETAGLAGKEITVITNGTAEHVRVAEMLLNMLSQIGLTVNITNFDLASYQDNTRNPEMYDIAIMRDFAPTLFYGGGLTNTVRFSPIFTAPGSWDMAETFADWAYDVFEATNDEDRARMTGEIVNAVTSNVLILALVDYYVSEGFASDLPDPYVYQLGSYRMHGLSLYN